MSVCISAEEKRNATEKDGISKLYVFPNIFFEKFGNEVAELAKFEFILHSLYIFFALEPVSRFPFIDCLELSFAAVLLLDEASDEIEEELLLFDGKSLSVASAHIDNDSDVIVDFFALGVNAEILIVLF